MNKPNIFKPLQVSLLVFLFIAGTSCEDFLDVNTDPNAATEAPGDLLFTEAAVVLQSNRNIELGPVTAFFAQTFASNGTAAVFTEPDRYIVAISDLTVTNPWGSLYPNVLNNLELFIRDAQDQEPVRNNAIAQARLLQAYTFYNITALWGEVPFSEALDPEVENPVFDDQETILRGILSMIDEAVALIDPAATAPPIEEGDVFYDGDMEQWLKFGNSLKLRILMLLYNQDTSATVTDEIDALINNADLVRANADNFEFPYSNSNGNENQMYQLHADFAAGEPAFLYGSETLIDLMNSVNDPRRATYFEEAPVIVDGEETGTQGYIGRKNGESYDEEHSLIGENIIRADFPGRILTASETHLHEAEYLAREGNFADARTSLQAGIEASIDYFDGVDGAITDTDRDTYVTGILSSYDAGSNADKVRIIQEQHFIDVFEKSPENWTLWRRTKVPDLEVPTQAQLSTIIRRLPISNEELTSNTNAPSPVPSRDTPMWFEQ